MIKGKLTVKPKKAFGKLNKEIVIKQFDASDADAVPGAVVLGRTFYAGGSDKIQTGTLKAYRISLAEKDGKNTLEADALGFNPWDELTQDRIFGLEIDGVEVPVGIDTSDATINKDVVLQDYIGYGKDGERIVGDLRAYNVEEQIIEPGKSRLIVTKLQDSDSDDPVTAALNIEFMKAMDMSEVIEQGGILATDEEYIEAEKYVQIIAHKVMLGE